MPVLSKKEREARDRGLELEDLLEETQWDTSDKKNVIGFFTLESKDVMNTIRNRERKEDKKLGDIYHKVKEIHEHTFPEDILGNSVPEKVVRSVVIVTGWLFGSITTAVNWIGKRTKNG